MNEGLMGLAVERGLDDRTLNCWPRADYWGLYGAEFAEVLNSWTLLYF